MYYHVKIETNEKVGKAKKNKEIFELDKTQRDEILEDILIPYSQNQRFQVDGFFVEPKNVIRILVKRSEQTTTELADIKQNNMSPGIIFFYTKQDMLNSERDMEDVTKEMLKLASVRTKETRELTQSSDEEKNLDKTKVFIVHGHDDLAKTAVARFVEKLGLTPIILHEQASSGKTIIEKIEDYSDVGFGIVLYTPCDTGASGKDPQQVSPRARQNVVFEHGFLIGKLKRENVCALVKGDLEKPNDISGVVYVSLDDGGAWQLQLAKEMKGSGIQFDMNKAL